MQMSLTSHRCCGCQKILEQAQTFSVSYIVTLQGLCIHRKAINKDKPSLSSGVLPSRQRFLLELYPRALPPVTHGSALQAPERMWILMLCLASRHQSACGY